MAGAIPILPTRAEYLLIKRLVPHHMATLLTMLDEGGWSVARDLLSEWGQFPMYQPDDIERNPKNPEEWR